MIDLSTITACPLGGSCGHVCNAFCQSGVHCTITYTPKEWTAQQVRQQLDNQFSSLRRLISFLAIYPAPEAPKWEARHDHHLYFDDAEHDATPWVVHWNRHCPPDCPRFLASQAQKGA